MHRYMYVSGICCIHVYINKYRLTYTHLHARSSAGAPTHTHKQTHAYTYTHKKIYSLTPLPECVAVYCLCCRVAQYVAVCCRASQKIETLRILTHQPENPSRRQQRADDTYTYIYVEWLRLVGYFKL